jgi:hypothetical protein
MTLVAALGSLTPMDRAIVVLRYTVAELVGVVKTQSMRALVKLREPLGEDLFT